MGAHPSQRPYQLTVGTHLVGRSPIANLRLTDSTVSPGHAEITVAPSGRVFLRDLNADNAVLVNGTSIRVMELFDGARISLGRSDLLLHCDAPDTDKPGRGGFDRTDEASQAGRLPARSASSSGFRPCLPPVVAFATTRSAPLAVRQSQLGRKASPTTPSRYRISTAMLSTPRRACCRLGETADPPCTPQSAELPAP